ncbi:hypothetical protein K488DRAFT_43702 [Vararia minispora EC-137]|uniref:Uncharacterized protein n=1 Tax=Vararia minispora EC-137 TaxID=1314806 RepID=A0ACB8QTS1_9AGAM|nr:hypothetical protein K488DRAFT_43702 [Vararia minispora EC-137]
MDECPGVRLDKVIDSLSHAQLDHIAEQLSVVLAEMRSLTSGTLGSVSGGPYLNLHHAYPLNPSRAFSTLLSVFRRDDAMHFAHGDLLPRNILVEGSTVTAIVDWETAGFYPAFWEYCRMHDRNWRVPGWDYVLSRVFPGCRRTAEIGAMDELMAILAFEVYG